jgi:hypothetical protein
MVALHHQRGDAAFDHADLYAPAANVLRRHDGAAEMKARRPIGVAQRFGDRRKIRLRHAAAEILPIGILDLSGRNCVRTADAHALEVEQDLGVGCGLGKTRSCDWNTCAPGAALIVRLVDEFLLGRARVVAALCLRGARREQRDKNRDHARAARCASAIKVRSHLRAEVPAQIHVSS